MIEQELREKIAKPIFRSDGGKVVPTWEQVLNHEYYLREADSIISLIKADGWVKLSDDQTLPTLEQFLEYLRTQVKQTAPYPIQYATNVKTAITIIADLMLKAGFRKVEL